MESGGLEPAEAINPLVVAVMKEVGLDPPENTIDFKALIEK
jgi:hypothetical protein